MSEMYARIRRDLESLRGLQHPPDDFCIAAHRFQTHPPLSEAEVQAFEWAHQVTLPAEYRGFLIHVGNGGAGPAYGLFKLGEMDDGWGHTPWREGGPFVGTLAQPFPHSGPWNDLTGKPDLPPSPSEDEELESEARWEAWDNGYWDSANVNGAIPICHLGCALRQWLVVTGPEVGHVWGDDRADYLGLYPLTENGERVTFLRWYTTWLDDAIRRLRESSPR